MTVSLKSAIQVMQGHLEASGYFPGGVSVGEPSDPPSGPYAALLFSSGQQPTTTLNKTVERRTWMIRVYTRAFTEPRGDIEFWLDEVYADILTRLLGDFTLDGNVRNIEPLLLNANAGYQTIGGVVFRLLDISVPMIVDDSATFAP